jgi:RNA polymerase sigma-70 factor (ECF subfamily)
MQHFNSLRGITVERRFGMEAKPSRADDLAKAVLRDYSNMVFRLALSQLKHRQDSEDVFQEVFLRFIKSDKPFENEEHIKAWLIRVTINCCNKLRSTAWFRRTVALEDNHFTEHDQEKTEIYDAVLELPPKYRTVIHLFYYEDMSAAEISKTLGIKIPTINSQLNRGRNILRKKLKGDYDFE